MRPSPNLQRFIPAGAGNTRLTASGLVLTGGLSPLARGTLMDDAVKRAVARFIPAGAGNTPRPQQRGPQRSVYPRWRGEHIPPKPPFPLSPGLSPLARGTPPPGVRRERSDPVYPRWRGEHVTFPRATLVSRGLSPLARGTQTRIHVKANNQRFIPAGAGNTAPRNALFRLDAVYPRWRGEHDRRRAGQQGQFGLSPLARGTHALIQ